MNKECKKFYTKNEDTVLKEEPPDYEIQLNQLLTKFI